MKIILAVLLATILVTSTLVQVNAADSKIVKSIDKALKKYSDKSKDKDLCFIIAGKESNLNGSIIWNNTKNVNCGIPVPEPVPCDGQVVNGTCVPNPIPQPCVNGTIVNGTCTPNPVPEPQPSNESKKVVMVGDISGTAVLNQIKKENPDYVIALGDLGYGSNLKFFRDNYGAFGNKLACVIGNHDSAEDGSSTIEKEALAFCGNDYFVNQFNGAVFIGLNTNGDLSAQSSKVVNFLKGLDNNVSSVHIASHKPICQAPPKSHHPVESGVKNALCTQIKDNVPAGVKLYFDSGHNHVLSLGVQEGITFAQSGAGGKSHYECGTDDIFTFCNNSKYGFLEYTIEPTGKTSYKFIDSNGGVIN